MNKIKRLRAERGWSMRELAAKADIDHTTISFLENGQRKAQLATLGKLARAFDVPLDDLMEFVDTGAKERGRKGGRASAIKEHLLTTLSHQEMPKETAAVRAAALSVS